jgi:two-component system, chemotaxis family, chemotaxis protein CheY
MTSQPHHSMPAMVPPVNCFTILVIDDLVPNRVLLRKVLEGAGYAVLEASNGIEALELLRDRSLNPDLIVTDIEMPAMDGIAMIERVRLLDHPMARVPIIAASGNADESMRRSALGAGSDVFLTKPFDLGMLRREIARLITSRRQVPPARSQANLLARPLNRVASPVKEVN